jgi:hypothetical protein
MYMIHQGLKALKSGIVIVIPVCRHEQVFERAVHAVASFVSDVALLENVCTMYPLRTPRMRRKRLIT